MDIKLDKLEKYVKNCIKDVLNNEVAESVKNAMGANIKRYVYDVYEPKIYKRRGVFGDRKSFIAYMNTNNHRTLWVENIATGKNASNKRLDSIIETGKGYDYDFSMIRPWYTHTMRSLNKNQEYITALKNGLLKKGFIER